MTDPPGTDQLPPHTHNLAPAVTLHRAGERNICPRCHTHLTLTADAMGEPS